MAVSINLRLVLRLARLFLPVLRKRAQISKNEIDNVAVDILEILLSPEAIKMLEE